MNAKSIAQSTQGMPSIVAVPAIIASPRPVATSASLRRSVYGRRSVNASGSAERRPSASWTEAARVGELLDALLGADGEVVAADGADAQDGAQLVLAVVRLADRARVRMELGAGRRLLGRRLLALHLDLDVFGLLVARPPACLLTRTRSAGRMRDSEPGSGCGDDPPSAASVRGTTIAACRHASRFSDAGVAFDADGALAPAGAAGGQAAARDRRGGDPRGRDAAVDPERRRRARRALQHAAQGLRGARGAGLRDDAPRLRHGGARARRRRGGGGAARSPTGARERAASRRRRATGRARDPGRAASRSRHRHARPARAPRGPRAGRRTQAGGARTAARAPARCCRRTSRAARMSAS